VEALGEQLPINATMLIKLTDYAGIWRYQEPETLLPEQRDALKRAVADLRAYTLIRLNVLRPGVDWTEFN